MDNYGKKFESKLREDWLKLPDAFIVRLKDIMSGYKKIKNISDFVGYIYPFIYFIEAKTTKEGTFNFAKLTQYDELKKAQGYKGVNAGVIIWFYNKQKVCYVPIEECVRIKEELGAKSISAKMIGDSDYNVYEIPGSIRRTFIDSDYSIMKDIAQQKYDKMIGE